VREDLDTQQAAGADSRRPFCLRSCRGIRCSPALSVPGSRRLRLSFSFAKKLNFLAYGIRNFMVCRSGERS
jgi:hypothetical protein